MQRTVLGLTLAIGAAIPLTATAATTGSVPDTEPPLADALQPQPLAERTTIRVGMSGPLEVYLPFLLADHYGELDAENLTAEVSYLPPQESLLLVDQGDLDVTASAPTAGLLNVIAEGDAVRQVLTVGLDYGGESPDGLWLHGDIVGDDGVQPADLAGHTILTSSGRDGPTAAAIYTHATELDPTLTLEDFDFQRMDVAQIPQALINGAVGGGQMATPLWVPVEESGCCAWAPGYMPTASPTHWVFGTQLLEEDRDAGHAFVRALARTMAKYLQGDYHNDPTISADMAELLELPLEAIQEIPSPAWPLDLPLYEDENVAYQDYYFLLGEVLLYTEPLAVDQLFDTEFRDAVAAL